MNNVLIRILGENSSARRAFREVVADTNKLDNAAGKAAKGMSGMFALAGIAGAATLAAGIGKVTMQLATMGEELQNTERELAAYTGSAASAEFAIATMDEALGNAMTRQQKAATVSRLLSMGLVQNADAAAEMAEAAALLGKKTQTASQRIDDFSMLLANKSRMRLDQFGLSIGQVEAAEERLRQTNAALTEDQLFSAAVMDIARGRVQDLKDEGVELTTTTEQVTNAWNNFIAALGKKVDASGVGEYVEGVLGQATAGLNLTSKDDATRLQGLIFQLEQLEDMYTVITTDRNPFNDWNAKNVLADIEDIKAEIESINAAIAAVPEALAGQASYIRRDTPDYALGMIPGASQDWQIDPNTWWKAATDDFVVWDPDEIAREAELAAARSEAEYKAMLNRVSGYAANALGAGMAQSKGLLDLSGGDPLAAGANGPFEDIYRLQAFISDGSHGDIAAKYGLDKAGAEQVVADFQKGKFTDQVKEVIDQDALVQYIKDMKLADEMQKAFAEDIAKQAGVQGDFVNTLIFGGKDKEGKFDKTPVENAAKEIGTTIVAKAQEGISESNPLVLNLGSVVVESGFGDNKSFMPVVMSGAQKEANQSNWVPVVTALGSQLDTAITDKSGLFENAGAKMWTSMESSIVNTATTSNVWRVAIMAMIASIMADATE